MSVDWEKGDPFSAYVATRKEWNLLRHSKARVERFPDYLANKKGCSADAVQAIAQKWMAFTDVIISEKAAAMEQRRDVDFEQYRGTLEELRERQQDDGAFDRAARRWLSGRRRGSRGEVVRGGRGGWRRREWEKERKTMGD